MAIAMAAMAGLQLAGSYFAAQNMKETARINQDIAEMNAEFAELDAHDALVDGESQQARYQSVVDETLSDQQTALAAAGVDTGFGSAGAIEDETRFTAELNAIEIQKRSQEKALGFKQQARDIRLGGAVQRSQTETQAGAVQAKGITDAAKTGISGYKDYLQGY